MLSTEDKEVGRRWPRATASRRARARGYRSAGALLGLGIAIGVLAATALYAANWTAANRAVSTPDVIVPIPGPPASAAKARHPQPTTLRIPAIGVDTTLVDLGLNNDKTLQTPSDYQRAGWFAAGPAPGDAGGPPAIIAGHVDSVTGPAIFYRLHELVEGSVIEVSGVDGVVRQFRVYRMADYAKSAFPGPEVYASSERAELRVITCTGTFDPRAGSYLSNLVVYAALVDGG